MHLFVTERIAAPPMGVEIRCIIRHIGESVINLIVEYDLFSTEVLNSETRTLAKGHFPVGIHATCWIDSDRKGVDIAAFAPTIGEKVAIGTRYGGMFFP